MPNRYAAIPDPNPNISSLYESVSALKQVVEVLVGDRGDADMAAATRRDLAQLAIKIPPSSLVLIPNSVNVYLDLPSAANFSMILESNRTIENPALTPLNQRGCLYIMQNGVGGHTLTWGSSWHFVGGPPTIATGAGAVTIVEYVCLNVDFIFARANIGVT